MGLFNRKKKKETLPTMPQPILIQLLFREMPKAAAVEEIRTALEKRIGSLGEVPYAEPSDKSEKGYIMLPVTKYKAVFKDHPEGVPVMATFLGPSEFNPELIDSMAKSQFWEVENGKELLDSCKYMVCVNTMMGTALEYKQQAELLLAQVGAALDCYPECCALFASPSGKLTTPEDFRSVENEKMSVRFVRLYLNARFFKLGDTEEMIVDTLGLHAFPGSDVQVHFCQMEPDYVVSYVYSIAQYQFDNNFPIKDGETVDSIDENGNIQWEPQWKTQYEISIVDPKRPVLDVNCGKFAGGKR